MPKKLLHIVPDDKFIDCAIDLFDSTSVENRYVCLVDSIPYAFRYVKNITRVECIKTEEAEMLWNDFSVDMFCFHTLDYSKYQYLLSIPKTKKILWLSWGYDLYAQCQDCPPVLNIPCFKPLTQKYVGYKSWKTYIKEWLHFILHLESSIRRLYKSKQSECRAIRLQRQVFERVDYISTVLPIEYDMLRKNTGTRAQYFPFQYSSRKKTQDVPQMSKNADSILVGNSATMTNNHLDILSLLEQRGITNVIQMPLSYGDKYYAGYLMQVTESSKMKINVISDFIEKGEYASFLTHCRALVLGCIRQQALGNIIMMLSQGGKVFLYKDSMDYQYLKKEGFVVFTIEQDLTNENINAPLTESEIAINRKRIADLWSYENVLMRLNSFLTEECV